MLRVWEACSGGRGHLSAIYSFVTQMRSSESGCQWQFKWSDRNRRNKMWCLLWRIFHADSLYESFPHTLVYTTHSVLPDTARNSWTWYYCRLYFRSETEEGFPNGYIFPAVFLLLWTNGKIERMLVHPTVGSLARPGRETGNSLHFGNLPRNRFNFTGNFTSYEGLLTMSTPLLPSRPLRFLLYFLSLTR